MSKMIAVIIGNGEACESMRKELPKNPFVICADGGIRHTKKLGLKADIVIGDMDSAGKNITDEKTVVYPVRKDYTDSELAVGYALDNGFNEIYMVGFTGTRMDHTLTNLFLLHEIHEKGAKGVILDEHNCVYYAEHENIIHGEKGDLISIIPIGEDVLGITTEGLEYPLNDETLFYGKSRGVSNVMKSTSCKITLKSGKALIIKSKD